MSNDIFINDSLLGTLFDDDLRPVGTEFTLGRVKYRVVAHIKCFDTIQNKFILREEIAPIYT